VQLNEHLHKLTFCNIKETHSTDSVIRAYQGLF